MLLEVDASDDNALSVSELNLQIKRVLESDPILTDIAVRGEISNFKLHSSGHVYFTLKDDAGQVRCAMWRARYKLRFRPSDGDRIIATGRIEFYGQRGEVNFIVDDVRFAGQGELFEAFEQLKRDLAAEGLFDPERKKPLPPMPRRIGLITSPTGAVAHDVISILARRWPLATIVFIPAAVQGFMAAPDLVRALGWAASLDDLDVLIMARGGGSAEDLWCFNDEDLARAAAAFPKPLISAIGHETDFTILDFVADLRAPTPSAAAELVAPDIAGFAAGIESLRRRLYNAAAGDVRLARHRLQSLRARRVLTSPAERLSTFKERVERLRESAIDAARERLRLEKHLLAARHAQLHALDPRRVLERGYALLIDAASGEAISHAASVQPGQRLKVALHDGTILAIAGPVEEEAP